jgi:hypothetical protein
MILAAMILIPAIAGGCKKYSQAEWDAGRLFWQNKSWQTLVYQRDGIL